MEYWAKMCECRLMIYFSFLCEAVKCVEASLELCHTSNMERFYQN